MHQTPWTRKASSVPSDRIRPAVPKSQQTHGTGKGKGKQHAPSPEAPKSQEVQRLEKVIDSLKQSSLRDRDAKGGCFCMAREHPLSSYTPICFSCGLILCSINLPQYSCPHCSKPLLTSNLRDSIITELDEQLAVTLAKEIVEKERAIEEAKKAAGAFPTLSGSAAPSPSPSPLPVPTNQSHKVMSLTQKKNKVVMSLYTPRPDATPNTATQIIEEPHRVPPPPSEVFHAKRLPDPSRPWQNLIGGGGQYIPPPPPPDELPRQSRRRKNKVKEKEYDGADLEAQS